MSRHIVGDILELLAISSVSGDSDGISAAQECLKQIAKDHGLETKMVLGDKIMLIAIDFETPKKLGFVTHIDTLPYILSNWSYNPLGELRRDRIYGRGVIDGKGPTVLAMYAMLESMSKDIMLIVSTSYGWKHKNVKQFLDEMRLMPDYLVSLDGSGIQKGITTEVPDDSKCLKALLKAYKNIIGEETKITIAHSLRHSSAFENCICFGPRFAPEHEEDYSYQYTDEYRSIRDISRFYEMLTEFIVLLQYID